MQIMEQEVELSRSRHNWPPVATGPRCHFRTRTPTPCSRTHRTTRPSMSSIPIWIPASCTPILRKHRPSPRPSPPRRSPSRGAPTPTRAPCRTSPRLCTRRLHRSRVRSSSRYGALLVRQRLGFAVVSVMSVTVVFVVLFIESCRGALA